MFYSHFVPLIIANAVLSDAKKVGGIGSRSALNHAIANVSFEQVCFNAFKTMHVSPGLLSDRLEQSSRILVLWAFNGFPDHSGKEMFRFLRSWYSIVLEWIFPHHLKGHRTHRGAWQLACLISNLLGLHDMWHFNGRIKSHRVMLRAFGADVQIAILNKSSRSKPWGHYLSYVLKSVYCPSSIKRQAACYFAWCQHQDCWYVGKANLLRSNKSNNNMCDNPGAVGRYQDHVICTRAKGGQLRTETRYKRWKNAYPFEFCFVLFCWGSEQEVLSYEKLVINRNQAPIQNRVSKCSFRPKRERPHRRFREAITIENEIGLNFCHEFRIVNRSPILSECVPWHVFSFKDLCDWQADLNGLTTEQVKVQSYTLNRVGWLALLLAQNCSRLDYKKVWQSGTAQSIMLGVWCASLFFERKEAQKVQAKVERFLKTSPLINPRSVIIRVPTHAASCVQLVRKQVSQLLADVHKQSPWLATFMKHKIVVRKVGGKKLSDCLVSHIQVAKNFSPAILSNVSKKERKYFFGRKDVVVDDRNWDIPIEHENSFFQQSCAKEFYKLCAHFRIGNRFPAIRQNIDSLSYVNISETQCILESAAKNEKKHDTVSVVLDKDPKRRCFMSVRGYSFRLAFGFIYDSVFYKPISKTSGEHVARYKQHILKQHIPEIIDARHTFQASNIAYGYHTYKAKCLGIHGLTCLKSHAHEREIVSYCANPIRRGLRTCAKAVRLLKRLSGEHAWTLWNQSQFKHVLLGRHIQLATVPQFVNVCICGKVKKPLCMIKADAAQFFKAASIERGIDRVLQLLNRVSLKTGHTAIAVAKNKALDGFLCKADRKSNIHHEVISFDRINQYLQFLLEDRHFLVGDVVVKRLSGWPMGGPFSEPGTLIDLQHDVFLASGSIDVRKRIGWHIEGLSLEQVMGGVMHVDDSLLFSKCLCEDCLEKGMCELWPKDVGCSKEDGGCCMRFLNSFVFINNDKFEIFPHHPNIPFVLGYKAEQTVSRLGPYLGDDIHSFAYLNTYLCGQIISYNFICGGDPCDMLPHTLLLLYEAYRLNWPNIMISKVLLCIPRRHSSPFIRFCRKLGKAIHIYDLHTLYPIEDIYKQIPTSSSFFAIFQLVAPADTVQQLAAERAMAGDWKKGNWWNPGTKGKGKGKGTGGGKGYDNYGSGSGGSNLGFGNSYKADNLNTLGEIGDALRQAKHDANLKAQRDEMSSLVKDEVTGFLTGKKIKKDKKGSKSSSSNKMSTGMNVLALLGRRLLGRKDSNASSASVAKTMKKKKKKEKKKKKKKKSSSNSSSKDSSDSSSVDSDSTNSSWLVKTFGAHKKDKKDAKKKKDDKKKDKKEKEKKKKDPLLPIRGTAGSIIAVDAEVSPQGRMKIITELKIAGGLSGAELVDAEWVTIAATKANATVLQDLCLSKGLPKTGSKSQLMSRLVDYTLGEEASAASASASGRRRS